MIDFNLAHRHDKLPPHLCAFEAYAAACAEFIDGADDLERWEARPFRVEPGSAVDEQRHEPDEKAGADEVAQAKGAHDDGAAADKHHYADAAHDPKCDGKPTAADDGIGNPKTHVPQITLITKRDTPALMSKRISLDGEGKLKSDGSECRMITGTAARAFVANRKCPGANHRELPFQSGDRSRGTQGGAPCVRRRDDPEQARPSTPARSPGRGAASTIGLEFLLGV